MKRIVKGNDFTLRIPVAKVVEGEKVAFPLPACTDVVVRIANQYKRVSLDFSIDAAEDNVILARVEGDQISLGTYAVEVRGKIFGNDWRSNEYPQFQIVNNNADADTEFASTDEGDDSVEMDTALVVLPPTAELSQLVSDTNEALDAAKATDAALAANEAARTMAETSRVEAEQARADAEASRSESETLRMKAEQARQSAETDRTNAEALRVSQESTRAEMEAERKSSETARKETETARNGNEAIREKNEAARIANENARQETETARNGNEAIREKNEAARIANENARQETETERIRQETARQSAETERTEAEKARVSAEASREATLAKTKVDCETATKAATDAASEATLAKVKAEEAATGAEKCNITMEGSTITVTDRDGNQKSVDVINTDEAVNLTITSSVDSVKVSGINVNVFINHGTTPVSYITDSEGKVSFTVNRGEYYEINVPQYGNAQPISPVGYTAVLESRDISLEYQPYDEESSEKVIVTVTKYTEGVASVWEGLEVACTVDKKTTTYATDSKGQATIYVPYNKEYTVKVENQDGYNVSFNKNSRTYTAKVPQRMIDYKMYQFRAGIFVVDAEGTDYYIDEWTAANKNADDAVAIKIVDAALMTNKATFLIRTSDIKNISGIATKQWCTQNLPFTSIALNGNATSDANYYNGETSSFLVRQEAQERSLIVPAFDYAYEQTFTIAGQTLNGFVMSVGQEYIHVANVSSIKQVLETLYGEEIAAAYYNFVMKKNRWTSTQSTAANACYCGSGAGNTNKVFSLCVLPVFACSLENSTSLSLDNSTETSDEQAA